MTHARASHTHEIRAQTTHSSDREGGQEEGKI
jgi:hypothetical protein